MHTIPLPDGERIEYILKKSAHRRSIGLRIGKDGLVVSIPTRLSMRELNAVLVSKLDWIQEKLRYHQENRPASKQWQSGEQFELLNQAIVLDVEADEKNRAVKLEGNQLQVRIKDICDKALIRHKVIHWYKQQALQDFERRTALLGQKLGVPAPPVHLSSARSRWGSCNHKGEIRLNWRLIQASPFVIQYVVAHELAHLKEMNHSAKFWRVVESLFPDYRTAEAELKRISSQLYAIDEQ